MASVSRPDEEWIELMARISMGRSLPRGWWLLIVLPALFALLGYLFIQQRGPQYTATATFRFDEANAALVRTFEELLISGPVLERVISKLSLDMDVDDLQDQVTSEKVLGTVLYRTSASNPDADLSAEIANAVPLAFESWYIETRSAEIAAELESIRPAIESIQRDIDATEVEGLRAQLLSERQALLLRRQQLLLEQARLADLLSLTVPAVPPTDPALLSSGLVPLAAALAGLGVAIAVIILWEGLPPRARRARDEIEAVTSLPVIGPIPSSLQRRFLRHLPTADAESRYLTVSIRLLASGDGIGPVVITSAQRAEERGILPLQIGLQLIYDGLRPVVIETSPAAKPLFEALGAARQGTNWFDDDQRDVAQLLSFIRVDGAEIPVLLPGSLSSPAHKGTARLGKVIAELSGLADVVVIGAEPVLSDPETLVLAGEATATLLGARVGCDTAALHDAAHRLVNAGARVTGVVLTTERTRRV